MLLSHWADKDTDWLIGNARGRPNPTGPVDRPGDSEEGLTVNNITDVVRRASSMSV